MKNKKMLKNFVTFTCLFRIYRIYLQREILTIKKLRQ